jgi:non-canonical poly(A) RNA polymerase PAPD5/7
MVVCSIQQHPALRSERGDYRYFTLGHYLVYFLKLFGDELDYKNTGISIRGEGSFFRKSSKNWIYFDKENYLAVECPQNQENDLGKSSYSIELVKKSFLHAYKILCSQSKKIAKTPLSSIIRIDELIISRSSAV